ncbi:sorting nexin-10-like isoform 2 [Camelus ferus]|nr:sorting nexin-10-like isoform 2 [Camelus ferus]
MSLQGVVRGGEKNALSLVWASLQARSGTTVVITFSSNWISTAKLVEWAVTADAARGSCGLTIAREARAGLVKSRSPRGSIQRKTLGNNESNVRVLQNALLLSDSSLHLFLQSHLNSEDIEACVSGQTKYSVEEAIHKFALMNRRFPAEEEEGKKENDVDYDSESSSSGFGHSSDDSSSHGCKMSPALQES